MLGTPEDLLGMIDLGTAVTAAPGAGSKMFPVHPSLWEQYAPNSRSFLSQGKKEKK